MADEDTIRMLGEIKGGQDAIQVRLDRQEAAIDVTTRSIHEVHTETTLGFGDVKATLTGVHERFDAHVRDNERSFNSQSNELARVYKKVCECRRDHGLDESKLRRKQVGIIGGVLTGLAAAGTWLANHLSSGGG
jgi:hypothetical protein